jgi:hypothetical protein
VGEDVATILARVPTLLAEVSRARGEAQLNPDGAAPHFVHLRLVLGGSELSLIPFELAFSPQSFPGEGLEFCLQLDLPVIPTRETRRSRPIPASWAGRFEPKVLVISAAPEGLEVPLPSHIQVLRAAVEPWIGWPRRNRDDTSPTTEKDRLPFVKERLRLLPNASIEQIYAVCSTEKFTHVHILAHGDYLDVAGERSFGIALCEDANPSKKHVVDGKRLAQALQAENASGTARSSPLVVTLATCDAGHQGSVLVPGGSIAYELHATGIPWVFASQFPLTKSGSIRMVEALYPGLLRGDDPRQILYEVRRRLYMTSEQDHDWASMIVYASVPPDFDEQVGRLFERQTVLAINTSLSYADDLKDGTELDRVLTGVTGWLDVWRSRLPMGDGLTDGMRRAECYGMHGSTYKRIALLRYLLDERPKGDEMLRQALSYYQKAMAETAPQEKFHWTGTQALSISAALSDPPDPETFELTWHTAQRSLRDSKPSSQAWAHATLAELLMISTYHKLGVNAKDVQEQVVEHCKAIIALMGANSFQAESTRRQFQRYLDYWKDPRWNDIAKAAVDALH